MRCEGVGPLNKPFSGLLQILERPVDLHTLAADLAARHRRASQLQVARIDTAFRAFDAARRLETGQLQEAALRRTISTYFETEVEAGRDEEAEDLQGLPLRPAEPMLGADCRALLLQIEKSGQVHYYCYGVLPELMLVLSPLWCKVPA